HAGAFAAAARKLLLRAGWYAVSRGTRAGSTCTVQGGGRLFSSVRRGEASRRRLAPVRPRLSRLCLAWPPALGSGLGWICGFSTRGSVEGFACSAWGLPLSRWGWRGALCREGQVPSSSCAVVLSTGVGHPGLDSAAARAGGRRRGDRHAERGRGAPSRAEPGQAPPAAVQRPPARRQVLPLHRRDRRGRVPTRDVHARAAPPRRRLLRPVRQRQEGAGNARRAEPRLPVPAVRRAEARPPLRDSVPRLPHRTLPGSVPGLRPGGG